MTVSLVKRSSRRLVPAAVISEIPDLATPRRKRKATQIGDTGMGCGGVAFAVILAGTALSYLRG